MHNNASEILFCPIGQKGVESITLIRIGPWTPWTEESANDIILWWDLGLLCNTVSFYFYIQSKVEIDTVVLEKKTCFKVFSLFW